MDAHRGVLGQVGEAVLVDLGGDDARPGVEGDAVGRQVLVGPGHAVPGDGAEHDVRLQGLQVLVAHAPAGEDPGAPGLDHHVAGLGELLEGGHVLLGAEVHDDGPLAPVEVEVHEGDALDDRPRHLADVVTGPGLDLDHLGAEVDEGHGDGGRSEGGDLEDADAVEGGVGGHGHGLYLTDRQKSPANPPGHRPLPPAAAGSDGTPDRPTTGAFRCVPPVDPSKAASPKAKTPPSAAATQYP